MNTHDEGTTLTRTDFAYGPLSDEEIEKLSLVSRKIQDVQNGTMIAMGALLIEAKALLEHGDFSGWIEREHGLSMRTAQRLMSGARFLDGKASALTHLPLTIIYELSAPSAPADIVDEVVAAAEAGMPLTSDEIWERLETAERQREAAKRMRATDKEHERRIALKVKKNGIAPEQASKEVEASRRRAERAQQRKEDAAKKAEDERRQVLQPLFDYVIAGNCQQMLERALEDFQLGLTLRRMLTEALVTTLSGPKYPEHSADQPLPPPPDDAPDQTCWMNDRDYCLSQSARLTGPQQNILARMGERGLPTSDDLRTLSYIKSKLTERVPA